MLTLLPEMCCTASRKAKSLFSNTQNATLSDFFFFFFMQRGEQTVHLTVHMKVQKQSAPQWQISNQTDSSSTFFFSFSFYSVCPCNSLDLSYRNILIIFFSPNILAFQKSTSFDWKVVSPLDIFNSFFYQLNYILTLVCGA